MTHNSFPFPFFHRNPSTPCRVQRRWKARIDRYQTLLSPGEKRRQIQSGEKIERLKERKRGSPEQIMLIMQCRSVGTGLPAHLHPLTNTMACATVFPAGLACIRVSGRPTSVLRRGGYTWRAGLAIALPLSTPLSICARVCMNEPVTSTWSCPAIR